MVLAAYSASAESVAKNSTIAAENRKFVSVSANGFFMCQIYAISLP